jgi:predicted NBD/HSP70 family sugar kinase
VGRLRCPPAGTYRWGLSAPGLVAEGRVQGAELLGWMDVEAWQILGYPRRPAVSMNDAQAQALAEWLLRDGAPDDLLYIGIGTGVAGARLVAGELVHVEFSHLTSFADAVCGGCGRASCLDAQIGGHALPQPLTGDDRARVVRLLATQRWSTSSKQRSLTW